MSRTQLWNKTSEKGTAVVRTSGICGFRCTLPFLCVLALSILREVRLDGLLSLTTLLSRDFEHLNCTSRDLAFLFQVQLCTILPCGCATGDSSVNMTLFVAASGVATGSAIACGGIASANF